MAAQSSGAGAAAYGGGGGGGVRWAKRMARHARRSCCDLTARARFVALLSLVWALAWLLLAAKTLVFREELPLTEGAAQKAPALLRPPDEWVRGAQAASMLLHGLQAATAAGLAAGVAKGRARLVLLWLVTAGLTLLLYGVGALGLGIVADPTSATLVFGTLALGLGCMQQVYNFYRRLRDAQKAASPPQAPASTASRPRLPPPPPTPPPPPPSPALRPAPSRHTLHFEDEECADCV